MKISDTIVLAFTSLSRNGLRSILTTLGIIIGVGSVVLMVSVGASFQAYILGQLEGIGSNTVDVFPKGLEQLGRRQDSLTFEDIEALERLSTVTNIAPSIIVPATVESADEQVSPMIMGTYPSLLENYGLVAEYGRLITMEDNKAARQVVVLGPDTAEELFNTRNAVGRSVTISGRTMAVIGVTKEKGSLIGQDMDSMVTMPFNTARAITGQRYASYISMQAVKSTDLAMSDIKLLLRQRHGIVNPEDDTDKDDFLVRSAEQATSILGTVTLSITAFLVLVAGISLIVGGIGIMNIMLVSVSERTKEIGLRKAVGATSSDILWQFLSEAIVLTLTGGCIGILGGVFLAYIIAIVINALLGDFPFAVSMPAILSSIGMAFTIGIVFGIFPAKKAANLSPMEAMRYE